MMPSILQAFANRCPKRTWFLGAACIIEPLILNGLFIRQGYTPIQYPSVYEQTPNGLAILELVPTLDDTHIIEPLRIKNKICAYQIQHKRTLINECLGKYPTGLLEADLKEELLTPTSKTMWHEPLIGLGVGAIILHADLWPPSKRIQIIEHLNKRLGEPTDHIEGGEHLILWVLPTTSKDINIPATLQKLDGTPNSNQ